MWFMYTRGHQMVNLTPPPPSSAHTLPPPPLTVIACQIKLLDFWRCTVRRLDRGGCYNFQQNASWRKKCSADPCERHRDRWSGGWWWEYPPCAYTHSLAWSLAAYRTLTTAVSVSVFTVGEQVKLSQQTHSMEQTQFTNMITHYLHQKL